MNKLAREVKLISRNVLATATYYSRFNPLYYMILCRESPNFVRCKENPSSSADENVVSD